MQRYVACSPGDSGQSFCQYFDVSRGLRQAPPKTLSPREAFVEGEVKHLNQVASSVRASMAAFPKKVHEAEREIENWTRRLSHAAFAREQALKAYLQEMGTSKMMSWDRQLQICREAMECLNKVDENDPGKTPDDLIAACDAFTKRMGFVQVGEVELDEEDLAEPKSLTNAFGRICVAEAPAEDRAFGSERCAPRFMFGGSGDSAGKLCRPWGVCSDVTNRILVADRGNNRIQVFGEDGKFIFQFGKEGSRRGEFSRPTGVAVDKKCRIIVADKDNHRIQVFSFNGAFLFSFGQHGSKNGQFNYPWGVAADDECRIAVSDSKNHRVQLFNERGIFLAKFSRGEPRSTCPRGVAFRPDGSLLVTDFNNRCVLIVDRGLKKARKFGDSDVSPKPSSSPQGVACDASGRCVFSDSKNYRILVLDEAGNPCKVFGAPGNGPGKFECPQGVCFQSNGSIVVADSETDLIQVF